jgi:hypothetical protein
LIETPAARETSSIVTRICVHPVCPIEMLLAAITIATQRNVEAKCVLLESNFNPAGRQHDIAA